MPLLPNSLPMPAAAQDKSRDQLYVFFVATYLAQGLVGVAYEPIAYLLKDVLGLSAGQSATYTAWMTLPFLWKPLLGILSDAVPFARRRRVPYLWATSFLTIGAWLALALMDRYSYWPTLFLLTMVNVGIAFADVLCDAVMVEHGKRLEKTGTYQAAQITTLYLALFATGIGGGWLAQNASYRTVFALTAIFPLFIFATSFLVSEESSCEPPRSRSLKAIAELLGQRAFWAVALLLLLFNFTPFLGTAFFYYQSETLKFSKLYIGTLTSLGGLAGALGAWFFGLCYGKSFRLLKRPFYLDTLTLVRASLFAGAPLTLLYLAYQGPISAAILTVVSGIFGVIMRLSLMDLAAKACPQHAEATVFALFMGVFNLAALSSNTLGGKIYSAWVQQPADAQSAIAVLIGVSAVCMLSCWPILRWTPILNTHDR